MQRRDFIKFTAAGSTLSCISPRLSAAESAQHWRTYRLSYHINLPAKGATAQLWLPLPKTASGWQQASKVEYIGEADANHTIDDTDASYYHALWQDGKTRQCVGSGQMGSDTIFLLPLFHQIWRFSDLAMPKSLQEVEPIGSASQITSEGWPQLQANLKLPVVLALSPMLWRFSRGWIS